MIFEFPILNLNLNQHVQYTKGSIIIGGLIVVDAIMISAGYQTFVNQVFSLVELLWFMVSLFVIYQLSVQKLSFRVPLYYVMYYLFGFFLGSFWLAGSGNLDSVPFWYLVFAMLFGAYYFMMNLKIAKSRIQK